MSSFLLLFLIFTAIVVLLVSLPYLNLRKSKEEFFSLKNVFVDKDFLYLLAANIIVYYFAVRYQWSIGDLIWTYFFQSLLIGFFYFLRILGLKSSPSKKISGSFTEKYYVAFVFILFFTLFFFGYYFLIKKYEFDFYLIFLGSLVFLISHLLSFIFYSKNNTNNEETLGILFLKPYLRILPMQMVVLTSNNLVLPFFLITKIIADCLGYVSSNLNKYIPNFNPLSLEEDSGNNISILKVFIIIYMIIIGLFFTFVIYNLISIFSIF